MAIVPSLLTATLLIPSAITPTNTAPDAPLLRVLRALSVLQHTSHHPSRLGQVVLRTPTSQIDTNFIAKNAKELMTAEERIISTAIDDEIKLKTEFAQLSKTQQQQQQNNTQNTMVDNADNPSLVAQSAASTAAQTDLNKALNEQLISTTNSWVYCDIPVNVFAQLQRNYILADAYVETRQNTQTLTVTCDIPLNLTALQNQPRNTFYNNVIDDKTRREQSQLTQQSHYVIGDVSLEHFIQMGESLDTFAAARGLSNNDVNEDDNNNNNNNTIDNNIQNEMIDTVQPNSTLQDGFNQQEQMGDDFIQQEQEQGGAAEEEEIIDDLNALYKATLFTPRHQTLKRHLALQSIYMQSLLNQFQVPSTSAHPTLAQYVYQHCYLSFHALTRLKNLTTLLRGNTSDSIFTAPTLPVSTSLLSAPQIQLYNKPKQQRKPPAALKKVESPEDLLHNILQTAIITTRSILQAPITSSNAPYELSTSTTNSTLQRTDNILRFFGYTLDYQFVQYGFVFTLSDIMEVRVTKLCRVTTLKPNMQNQQNGKSDKLQTITTTHATAYAHTNLHLEPNAMPFLYITPVPNSQWIAEVRALATLQQTPEVQQQIHHVLYLLQQQIYVNQLAVPALTTIL